MKPTGIKRKLGMQSQRWAVADKVKSGEAKLRFAWSKTSIAGVTQMEAQLEDATFPAGFLWYRFETGNVICVAWSFVVSPMRRAGIRTAMHRQLLEWFPKTRMVVTGRATEESLPWLLKMGFVFNKDFDRWELAITPPKKEKTK